MVLVSHQHRFVYLKTKKTASTSVEAFFEPWCVETPDAPVEEYRDEAISEVGIVGARRSRAKRAAATWHAHMGAWQVFRALGPRRWFGYFKFTTIRNPFDKTVSEFLYVNRNHPERISCPMPERRAHFCRWLEGWKIPSDRYVYTIAGRPVVQAVIRYESLADDIAQLCQRLGLTPDLTRLAGFKRSAGKPREPYASYYDPASRAAVARAYAPELRRYGYSFQEVDDHAA